jgi:hypothetical protein
VRVSDPDVRVAKTTDIIYPFVVLTIVIKKNIEITIFPVVLLS